MIADHSIGVEPSELDGLDDPNGSLTGISPATLDRIGQVQELIEQGESEENIARFIAGHPEFTEAERIIARIVLRKHGLARLL